MNTQQYYRLAANTALNGSFAALLPVIAFLLPLYLFLPKKEMVFLALPFLLFSLFSYQSYLIQHERANRTESVGKNGEFHKLFQEEQFLLNFLPAPSLRMLLFHPDGRVYGEIRDIRFTKVRWFLPYFLDRIFFREYGLYDNENRLFATFTFKKKMVHVHDENGDKLVTINEKSPRIYEIGMKDKSFELNLQSKSLYTDIEVSNESAERIGRVRKGWMPLEWAKYFVDANTPVLTFKEEQSREERLALLTIFIKYYRYSNH